jgi:hypothetical protein
MILIICCYNEQACKIINIQDSQSAIDFHFFLLAIMLQQKIIDSLNITNKKKDVTLFDFTYKKVFCQVNRVMIVI